MQNLQLIFGSNAFRNRTIDSWDSFLSFAPQKLQNRPKTISCKEFASIQTQLSFSTHLWNAAHSRSTKNAPRLHALPGHLFAGNQAWLLLRSCITFWNWFCPNTPMVLSIIVKDSSTKNGKIFSLKFWSCGWYLGKGGKIGAGHRCKLRWQSLLSKSILHFTSG